MALDWMRSNLGLERGRMSPALSYWQLLGVCVGSMVGTGWVQGMTEGQNTAGTAVVASWTLVAVATFVMALVFAELGTRIPTSGGSARYPHLTFGRTAGFAAAWIYWIGAVLVVPIEAIVATESLGSLVSLPLLTGGNSPTLTVWGTIVAATLLIVFALVNLAGPRWLAGVNGWATLLKFAIPVAFIVALVASTAPASGTPSGGSGDVFLAIARSGIAGKTDSDTTSGVVSTVLEATASSGIVFAFLGFDQAVQFGQEAHAPRAAIGRATWGSIVLVFIFYLMLQFGFIYARLTVLDTGSSPFVAVALQTSRNGVPSVVIGLLRLAGFVGPASTGLLYVASSARLAYGAARNGGVPGWIGDLSPQRVPLLPILIALIVGLVFILPSPGWEPYIGFNSSATVLGFAFQPLALASLRRTDGFREAAVRAPAGWTGRLARDGVPLAAFVTANWLVLFGGWDANREVLAVMLVGLLLFIGHHYLLMPVGARPGLDLPGAYWLPFYLVGVGVVSWLSWFQGPRGVHGPLPLGVDLLAMAAVSVVTYAGAVGCCRRPPDETRRDMRFLRSDGRETAG